MSHGRCAPLLPGEGGGEAARGVGARGPRPRLLPEDLGRGYAVPRHLHRPAEAPRHGRKTPRWRAGAISRRADLRARREQRAADRTAAAGPRQQERHGHHLLHPPAFGARAALRRPRPAAGHGRPPGLLRRPVRHGGALQEGPRGGEGPKDDRCRMVARNRLARERRQGADREMCERVGRQAHRRGGEEDEHSFARDDQVHHGWVSHGHVPPHQRPFLAADAQLDPESFGGLGARRDVCRAQRRHRDRLVGHWHGSEGRRRPGCRCHPFLHRRVPGLHERVFHALVPRRPDCLHQGEGERELRRHVLQYERVLGEHPAHRAHRDRLLGHHLLRLGLEQRRGALLCLHGELVLDLGGRRGGGLLGRHDLPHLHRLLGRERLHLRHLHDLPGLLHPAAEHS
mmetsp:Transcript_67575/g.195621  ORF Transcript_67575/g.195621 Transcript_67575/m.195621 type:complete len:399 (-) Transcript_67575:376-1572(-)